MAAVTKLLIRVTISALLIGLVIFAVDLAHVVNMILSTAPSAWVLTLLIFGLQVDLSATRWSLAIEALNRRHPHHRLLLFTYMGQFAGLFLPASIGGGAVKALMASQSGVPTAEAVTSVVIERFLAMGSLILLAVLAMPFLTISVLEPDAFQHLAKISVLLAIAILALIIVAWRTQALRASLDLPLIGPALKYLFSVVQKTTKPRFLAMSAGVSILCQLTMILAVYVLAQGAGVRFNLIDCLIILPPVMLVAALPISIAGWGVREGAMIIGLALAGVPREDALALSIQFGLAGTLVGLIGCVGWFRTIDANILAQIKKFRVG